MNIYHHSSIRTPSEQNNEAPSLFPGSFYSQYHSPKYVRSPPWRDSHTSSHYLLLSPRPQSPPQDISPIAEMSEDSELGHFVLRKLWRIGESSERGSDCCDVVQLQLVGWRPDYTYLHTLDGISIMSVCVCVCVCVCWSVCVCRSSVPLRVCIYVSVSVCLFVWLSVWICLISE